MGFDVPTHVPERYWLELQDEEQAESDKTRQRNETSRKDDTQNQLHSAYQNT